MNEYKEAWARIKEYVKFVCERPKSERTDVDKHILRSYEKVLSKWAAGKIAFFSLCGLSLFALL